MAFVKTQIHFFRGYGTVIAGLWLMLSTGCAPARFVKPLDKGENALTFAGGGPLIAYKGSTIPIPLSSVTLGHGFRSSLTGFVGLHTTSLAFGVTQWEFGAVKRLVSQHGWLPGISVTPTLNIMYDKWTHQSSWFPQLDAHVYWRYSKLPNYTYVGMSNWFEPRHYKAEGEVQQVHWVPAIDLGHTFMRHAWDYTLEIKYIAPSYSNKNIVVDYASPGSNGAIGLYVGITKKF